MNAPARRSSPHHPRRRDPAFGNGLINLMYTHPITHKGENT